MIRLERFQMWHLVGFTPREVYENLERDMRDNLSDPTRDIVSIMRDEKVIAIAGINHFRRGVGEVWLICSKEVNEVPLEFFKFVYKLINIFIMELMGLHRVQMAIDVQFPYNKKWAIALGFSCEGIMKKYCRESDHYLYAKVKE